MTIMDVQCDSEINECHLKSLAKIMQSSGQPFNPLPFQFKSLLPGQEGCVFFQWAFKYTYLPLSFTTLRPAGGISIQYVLLR
jgi:hypothetical protein